jgi:serine/threonine-protein kinase
MLSRAFPGAAAPDGVVKALHIVWDVTAKANSLEGEIAHQTRKLEALERRGRALRAEIGRKVEELAQDESKALRDAATFAEEEAQARRELAQAQASAKEHIAAADHAERLGKGSRTLFERAGAARALIDVKANWVDNRHNRCDEHEKTAAALRSQIEELRGQLTRYAGAVEDDLNSGREKIAEKSRKGLEYEKRFMEACETVISSVRGRPEVRELLVELGEAAPLPSQRPKAAGASVSRKIA